MLGLGVLPGASADLTIVPQLLIGAGLAMALPVLTAAALEVNDPDGSRAASTIAARHAGIVVGILLLTPLLTAQLDDQHRAGTDAGTALLLDANLSAETKVRVGAEISDAVAAADGRLPDLNAAFDAVRAQAPPEEQGAVDQLQTGVEDQLQRAATHAFSLPFIGAALLAALALVPDRNPGALARAYLASARRRRASKSERRPECAAGCRSTSPSVARSASSGPTCWPAVRATSRCRWPIRASRGRRRSWPSAGSSRASSSPAWTAPPAISVSPARSSPRPSATTRRCSSSPQAHQIDQADIESAVRAGLIRAVNDAEEQGRLSTPIASLARAAAENAPIATVINLFQALPGDPSIADVISALGQAGLTLQDLGGAAQNGLDQLQGLLGGLGGLDPGSVGDQLQGLLGQ